MKHRKNNSRWLRGMTRGWGLPLGGLVLLLVVGCNAMMDDFDRLGDEPDSAGTDSSTDTDSATNSDSSTDTDSATDGDTGSDTVSDIATDTATDTAADTSADSNSTP